MAEKVPGEYRSWREELERIVGHVKEGLCLKSDSSGVFFQKISDFLRFLLLDEKGRDANVVALFSFFRKFRPDLCTPSQLKENQETIVDLCIKICQKFEEQPTA
jgi:hypothetical protein